MPSVLWRKTRDFSKCFAKNILLNRPVIIGLIAGLVGVGGVTQAHVFNVDCALQADPQPPAHSITELVLASGILMMPVILLSSKATIYANRISLYVLLFAAFLYGATPFEGTECWTQGDHEAYENQSLFILLTYILVVVVNIAVLLVDLSASIMKRIERR